jgi:hypothetical protein
MVKSSWLPSRRIAAASIRPYLGSGSDHTALKALIEFRENLLSVRIADVVAEDEGDRPLHILSNEARKKLAPAQRPTDRTG